jgi:hypothetical protein
MSSATEYTAKMVPESCCVKNQYGNYINLQKCQNWQLGPPNKQSGLDANEAVFYKVSFASLMLERHPINKRL